MKLSAVFKNHMLAAIKRQTKMKDVPKARELAPPGMLVVESVLDPWDVLWVDPDPVVVDSVDLVGAGVKSPLQP